MSPLIPVLQYAGYYAAAVPLAVCVWLGFRTKDRDPSRDAWLLSLGFFISFMADTIAHPLAQAGLNTWWLSYVYAPVQFALFVAVVAQHRTLRSIVLVGVVLLAIQSVWRDTLHSPETFVRVTGGVLVCFLLWGVQTLRCYRAPLWIYCGLTFPLLLAMGNLPTTDPRWLWIWAGYQLLRVTALALMTWTLVRKEVAYGGPRKFQSGRPDQFSLGLLDSHGSIHQVAARQKP